MRTHPASAAAATTALAIELITVGKVYGLATKTFGPLTKAARKLPRPSPHAQAAFKATQKEVAAAAQAKSVGIDLSTPLQGLGKKVRRTVEQTAKITEKNPKQKGGILELVQNHIKHAQQKSQNVHRSTPLGKKGTDQLFLPISRHTPTNILGRKYTGHAIDRMQERGIPPTVVEHTIKYGTKVTDQTPSKFIHYDKINNLSVITNSKGDVITTSFGKLGKS